MRSSRVAAVTVLAAAALAGCPFVTSGEGVGFIGSTSSGSGGAGGHGTGAATSSSGATSSSSGPEGCKEGDMLPCYTGMPVTSENFMPCHAGMAACQADGGLGPCMGDVTPQPDNCASNLNSHCDPKETPCTGMVSGTSSRAWGESLDDEGLGVAIDKDGNTIVAGLFNGTLDFGGTMKSTGDSFADGFVASYLPTGALNWVTQLGTDGTDVANAVTVDAMGNVFVAGLFHDKITFASPSTVPAVTGGPGIFVAKLDNTGAVIWAQGFTGDSGNHVPQAVAISADGSQLAVAGYTAGRLQVGTLLTLQTQSTNDVDGFVFTLDSSNGNLGWVRWVKEDNQGTFQSLNGVAFASDKSVVVAGAGMGNVDLGVGSPLTTHGNGTNVLVAKYNPDGSGPAWAQLVGDDNDVQAANGVAVGAADDVFLTGQFQKHLAFGTVMLAENSDAGPLPNAIFVARLDKTGAGLWAQAFTPFADNDAGAPADSAGLGIAVDAYGIVVGGYFTNALAFGSTAPLGASGRDALVMKLAVKDGSVLWYRQLGEMMDDQVNQVALDPSTQNPLGASVAVGSFTTGIDLGSGIVNGKGSSDIFFARLSP